MNKYEQQNMKGKNAKKGKILLWTGLILTVAAVIFLIIGFASDVIYAVVGGIALVLGISAVIFGLQLKNKGKGRIDTGMVKCKKCGYSERKGAEFCSECGNSM